MKRVIEILNAKKQGLDEGGGETLWYLVERDEHPEIVHPYTKEPSHAGDCLGFKTKADAVAARKDAYAQKIPLDAL